MYEKKTIYRDEFPKKLTEINSPPERLNCIGNIDGKIFEKTLAVVGSRQITSYGKRVVEKIVGGIAASGITIVSGFMYGVDEYAHQVCVGSGGRAVAVLPYGLGQKPPSYQEALYRGILDTGGLIISEFDNDVSSAKWTFPKRNRIVAGLSDATLVVEGAEDSGSLITAHFCLDYGRKLFAVPGPIDSVVSEGTNNLIKTGLASVVTSAKDILKFFGLAESAGAPAIHVGFTDKYEEIIYSYLRLENLTLDQISEKSGLDISTVGYKTTMMCLAGLLVQREGKFYVS